MSDETLPDVIEVTTAELAGMTSDELREAVRKGRKVEALQKELDLQRNMNRILMEQVSEEKKAAEEEREKRRRAAASATSSERIETNPEDDELPQLRIANEGLLTRQLMLEAQVTEAGRYASMLSSELSTAQREISTLRDQLKKAEEKSEAFSAQIDDLQASVLSSSSSAGHSSNSRTNYESTEKLEAENRELLELNAQLEQKNKKRKLEIVNLRSTNLQLKNKLSELVERLNSNEVVNDAALQRLKDEVDQEVPVPDNNVQPSGPSYDPEIHISGILDAEQAELLEQAAKEINALQTKNLPGALRAYFSTRLHTLDAMKRNLPTESNGAVALPAEAGTAALSSSAHIPAPSGVNWHEYDAAFLVLSVTLLTKLTSNTEALARKRRELADLQEDFNEFKRAQPRTATPSATGGSRKMSAETQQMTMHKKITELENQGKQLRGKLEQAEAELRAKDEELKDKADLKAKEALLEQKSQNLEERLVTLQKELEEVRKHLEEERVKLEEEKAKLEECRSRLDEDREHLGKSQKQILELEGLVEAKTTQIDTLKRSMDMLNVQIDSLTASLANKTEENNAQASSLLKLRSEVSTLGDQVVSLEGIKRRLENENAMKEQEAREHVRALTSELIQTKAAKDADIDRLTGLLETSRTESTQRLSSLTAMKSELEEITKQASTLAQHVMEELEPRLSRTEKELLEEKDLKLQLEKDLADTKLKLDELINSTEKLEKVHQEVVKSEAGLQSQMAILEIKAKELDTYQKKLPEIADEALEAEEKAVLKWLEHMLTKEKGATSSNLNAALASQLSLGTYSPGSAATQLANGLVARKIKTESFKNPAFVASVINLAKKDAFSDAAIAKLEEVAEASATGTASSGPSVETDCVRSLEECLGVAKNVGLRVFGVTGLLLYQANRRAITDLSLEVIRVHSTARTSVRAHPELSILYPGKDEAMLESKSPERLLLRWVNSFIEDYNMTHSDQPPRSKVTNLGRDFCDGRALGIVMASINQDWASLAEPAIDLCKKIVTTLQQAVWMRHLPPFLDSVVPIQRGDDAILTILLAQLLEWNSGWTTPLAKLPVANTAVSTASMLANTTTPVRQQPRAVSGMKMMDTSTPLKGHHLSQSSKPGLSSKYDFKSDPTPTAASTGTPQVTVKPVEEKRTGWTFW